ncbi:MAG TPA: hypothetical protein DIT67_06930 [Octadecabacter sp.]|nr:hypothetical protein [Octadecabacter sp.]
MKDYFKLITENALDFLYRSIEDFEDHPKYSVIHFAAAIELFLKARLVAEHWSLIVSNRKEPDWNKFVSGDFVSVGLDEAASKLEKVVRSGLGNDALAAFRKVSRHRNKMIHFHHEAISEPKKEELRREVAKEQLIAWYFLHEIITTKWKNEFEPSLKAIKAADEKLRELRAYLEVIFDQQKATISERTKSGSIYCSCPSCGFKAQEHIPDEKTPYEAECLVCNASFQSIAISCSACGKHLIFSSEGFATCDCGKAYEPEQLVEALVDERAAYIAEKDGDHNWVGNCADCSSYHTLVRMDMVSGDDYSWFCTSCLETFDAIDYCEWCGEPTTGSLEISALYGCEFCDGNTKLLGN